MNPWDDRLTFNEESLMQLDGKRFPLRLVPLGPIVAEGILSYHPEAGELRVEYVTCDPDIKELLKDSPKVVFKKES